MAKRGPRRKVRDGEIARELILNNGNITKTAQALDLNTKTIKARMAKNPNILAKLENADESMIDQAVEGLKSLLADVNFNAIKYVLDNKGRDRGFGSKQIESANIEADTSNKQLNLEGMEKDEMKLILASLKSNKRIEGSGPK